MSITGFWGGKSEEVCGAAAPPDEQGRLSTGLEKLLTPSSEERKHSRFFPLHLHLCTILYCFKHMCLGNLL
jgi:hypothetical protein